MLWDNDSDSQRSVLNSAEVASGGGIIWNTDGAKSSDLRYVTAEGGIGLIGNARFFSFEEVNETITNNNQENPMLIVGDPDGPIDVSLNSGVVVTNQRYVFFSQPGIEGVAGGATETCTNCANVYIQGAPTGSNITFTNGPYALWVDAGYARFDGTALMQSSAEVTGILVTFGDTTTDGGTGAGQATLDGDTGGCLMFRDTDDAGWTECDALNGTLTCSIDVDGACD